MLSTALPLLALLLPLASATITFNVSMTLEPGTDSMDYTLSSSLGLSDACTTAYAKPIDCTNWLILGAIGGGSESEKFAPDTLESLCTPKCWSDLQSWRDGIRSDCGKEELTKLNETLYAGGANGYGYGESLLLAMTEVKIPYIETLYWPTCFRDLSTNELCYLKNSTEFIDTASDTNPEDIKTFCGMNCLTQLSVFYWEVLGKAYGTEELNVVDATKLCPDLDTSKYPFLPSNEGDSTPSVGSNGSTTGGGNETGTGTGSGNGTAEIPESNGAGTMRFFWGFSVTVAAVVVGMGML